MASPFGTMGSPSMSSDGGFGSAPSSRRSSNAFQQHSRRGSVIPPYLMSDFNTAGPPPPGGHYQPSNTAPGRGASGGRHARRGSVMDIAADMLAGEAGVEQLDKARKVSDKIEDRLEQLARPIRPWLPGIGRFLIVVTFLEDALRIMTQLGDQNYYLQKHRGFPWGLSHLFLWTNVLVMLACSVLIIAKRYPEYATGGLLGVVLSQGFGYGLIFDFNFFLRNLSVIGGLLMALSDSLSQKKSSLVGIPSMGVSDTDRKKYFQLFGRVLLVFLFIGFIFNGQSGLAKGLVSISGLGACICVAIGYKARQSALFLVVVLTMFNMTVNAWWRVHASHPQRDFLKYDFFQTLSIVGGLLLLVNLGAGDFAVEQKKRI
ncbi:hypothetical protein JCM10908_003313 [Rhodotorula pacifica]|uniref:protein ERV29 n=1 Tax=Rhodotorula pacifica TaxID=1495444 RepID=UPI0031816E97